MSSFNPAAIRQAVAEFTPRRPEKFQDLFPAKDVIAELRRKRASYRAIAELLTQHCLPTSKTAIAMFCHEVLGEVVRPRRRPGRKRSIVTTVAGAPDCAVPSQSAESHSTAPSSQDANGNEATTPIRARGPRIAQVRMLTPQEK